VSPWDSFVLLCRFLKFFKPHRTDVVSTIEAGFGKTGAVFKHPLSIDGPFYPLAILFCYTIVFLTFFTAVIVVTFVRISAVRIVNHFLEIIPHTFGFLFLPLDERRTSENLSTETTRYRWRLWVWQFWWRGKFHENFGWRLFLRNQDVCCTMVGCRSEGVLFNSLFKYTSNMDK
jgi:hypothetical protein